MRWKRHKAHNDALQLTSMSSKLKKEGKINSEFEVMLSNLPLEDIIALKLELASKIIHNTFIGLPLWYSLKNIAADALLKYAFSIAKTKNEAALMLGLTPLYFDKALYKYGTLKYFANLILKFPKFNGIEKKKQKNVLAQKDFTY
jgi:hypothetical protein